MASVVPVVLRSSTSRQMSASSSRRLMIAASRRHYPGTIISRNHSSGIATRSLIGRYNYGFETSNPTTKTIFGDNSNYCMRFLSTSNGGEEKKEEQNKKDEAKVEDTTTQPPPPKGEEMQFQAETKQLLDIVTNSLYTDKEVFLRELVSNASDALEKLRHLQSTNAAATIDPDVPLEIRIELDEVTSSITITDTGIGMTRDEMIENLGTIARSGSKAFMNQLERYESEQGDAAAGLDISRGIIGKFGVGFYSAFMVGDKVQVRSKSALEKNKDIKAKIWTSAGASGDKDSSSFEIADLQDNIRQDRGSSVVIYLKEDFWNYCDENFIEKILKRYSNFVNFPIYLNGKRVNTLEAVWAKDPKEVDETTYTDFYKYISNNIDEPLDTYHFRVDAPLDVKALFFIPSFHTEKYGMDRMQPGVSLYSRKVLIESKSQDILPDWLRFVKGCVDSEDLPLAISREKPQDTALITKLRKVLTRKIIAHLTKMAKKDRDKFVDEFYKEYAFFLKEGICQDFEFQEQLSKLLYFQTSKTDNVMSLDEYVANMRPEQKDIYYLCSPNRTAAMHSPYLEAFEKANVEVLFMYTAIEDFVMANLETYQNRKLVSVEKGDIDLSALTKDGDNNDEDKDGKNKDEKNEKADKDKNLYESDEDFKLSPSEAVNFCNWFKLEVGDEKVHSCVVTDRLVSSPAIVTDNESGAVRRMMRLVDTQNNDGNRDYIPLPKQNVEINPNHKIIGGIYKLSQNPKTEALAKVLAEQVYDNCLIAAGLLDDSRQMLPRINDILLGVVQSETAANNEANDDDGYKSDSDSSGSDSSDDETDSNSNDSDSSSDDDDDNKKKVENEAMKNLK